MFFAALLFHDKGFIQSNFGSFWTTFWQPLYYFTLLRSVWNVQSIRDDVYIYNIYVNNMADIRTVLNFLAQV